MSGSGVMNDERDAFRITALCNARDFPQRLGHVFVGVQVIGAEVAKRIEYDYISASIGNRLRDAL